MSLSLEKRYRTFHYLWCPQLLYMPSKGESTWNMQQQETNVCVSAVLGSAVLTPKILFRMNIPFFKHSWRSLMSFWHSRSRQVKENLLITHQTQKCPQVQKVVGKIRPKCVLEKLLCVPLSVILVNICTVVKDSLSSVASTFSEFISLRIGLVWWKLLSVLEFFHQLAQWFPFHVF